ncbi:MAG TPA: ribbon-helix-helix protein, CopG family [Chloroflexota bacterium]|nr:ribbon-helix-helix protein, CopG family [Chloroflexota bacterium]
MHRTQVYLEDELVAGLQRLARQEGTSMGELIRRGAREVLEQAGGREPWAPSDAIWELFGAIKPAPDGPLEDTSSHADHYLYDALSSEHELRVAETRGRYRVAKPRV